MIFDAILLNDRVKLSCALEDYNTEPVYWTDFWLEWVPKDESEDAPLIGKLESSGWHIKDLSAKPPSWVQQLGRALENRIVDMLVARTPQNLRRWIAEEEFAEA